MQFDPQTQKNVESWLSGPYDETTKAEIRQLIIGHPKQLADAFYTTLAFGTGGIRGIMGVGTNRMNPYTVRGAAQGLANYIHKQPQTTPNPPSVLIGYDCRHHSRKFAEETAMVLAGNNIHVYIFKKLRPSPLVSFGCRYKHCIAAIMITASHNPPEYNGLKIYWSDGAQVLPPHDTGIVTEVNKIKELSQVKAVSFNHPLITTIDHEIDLAYIKTIHSLQSYPDQNSQQGSKLKIVYSNLHGAGITMVPQALKSWGMTEVIDVEEQKLPDGNFPTVAFPNPEEKGALKLGIKLMLDQEADILIATDPDTDRMGVALRHQGKAVMLSGNQIACLCLYHICEALTAQGKMPKNGAFIKTIVTTELFKTIATSYKKPCFDVLTGFKYIGEKIRQWEEAPDGYQYLFGGEESYGYLLGTHARDKDAVVSACLISEAALNMKLKGKTLIDLLYQIYQEHGIYSERLLSLSYQGNEGREKICQMMLQLRTQAPMAFAGVKVVAIEDYKRSIKTWIQKNSTETLTLPKSDVLLFWLEDGSKLVIRPSGTEPKIKLYCGVNKKHLQENFETLEKEIISCDTHAKKLLEALKEALS